MANIEKIIDKACNQYTQTKYAMYLRKSRADVEAEALGEGETLARHKNILMKLAEKHNINPDQIEIYQEVVSGDSLAARPEAQRLMRDLYLKKYKGVLVMEVERLARGNTKDQGEVADAFQYSNTHIITPAKVYDPQNEFDQEYFEFGLFMSRREYKTIRRRMEAGRAESIAEGNYVGSARPYGFNIERRNKKERVLVINPNEAPVVQMIFDWWTVDRLNAGQIARNLTDMNIPTYTGNKEWNRGTINDILKNHHYIGKVRWDRRKTSKEFDSDTGKVKSRARRLSLDKLQVFEGKHDGFISEEQFELAQTLFTHSVPVHLTEEIVNPLAHLLVCKDCGKTIKYQGYNCKDGRTTPRYWHATSKFCTKKSLPVPVVMDTLIASLKAICNDMELKMNNDYDKAEAERHVETIALLQAELEKQEKKRRRIFDSWEADDGTYTKEEFIERKNVVSATIEEIKKQIQEAKTSSPEPVDYGEQIAKLHDLIDLMQDPTVSGKIKNDSLKDIITKIEYDAIDFGRNKGGQAILDIHLKD